MLKRPDLDSSSLQKNAQHLTQQNKKNTSNTTNHATINTDKLIPPQQLSTPDDDAKTKHIK